MTDTPGVRSRVAAEPDRVLVEAGSRRKSQAAPPHALFEALTQPRRSAARSWLRLLDDERPPVVIEAREPDLVVWSSLWPNRPDASVRFHLANDRAGQGTDLRWTLLVEPPAPAPSLLGHLRRRLNELINADLRLSFGQ